MGLKHIILEGDAMTVVNAFKSTEVKWSSARMFIDDIKNMLAKIDRWSVQHVPMIVNKVAHALAKSALGIF